MVDRLRVADDRSEDRFPVADGDGGGRHGMEALIRQGREGSLTWSVTRTRLRAAWSLSRVRVRVAQEVGQSKKERRGEELTHRRTDGCKGS